MPDKKNVYFVLKESDHVALMKGDSMGFGHALEYRSFSKNVSNLMKDMITPYKLDKKNIKYILPWELFQ